MCDVRVCGTQSFHQRRHLSQHLFAETISEISVTQPLFNLMGKEYNPSFQMTFARGASSCVVAAEPLHLVKGFTS